ncbi:LIC_13387 family protein [Zobellia laminariae]|uniref:LIC_13387 family protein n=1 Tax=Zobellia laminariae TaxID=248906 RepID=UPI0026F42D7B|nr:hypothetical protein [Zobellia laminariae]WKX74709.1 hypothetical protein Q5W13_12915 [Zobellia laminariae]
MKSITFEKIGGITMLITGLGHTTTHFILENSTHPHPELKHAMKNTLIKIGSEVSVLDFHNGFSLAMGLLLISFGVSILRNKDKTGLLINLAVAGLMVLISALYFPVFVLVLTSISFTSLLLRTLKYDSSPTN